MHAGKELRSLRDRPFELLKELDRRSRERQHGHEASDSGEWVGIAIRSAGQQWLVPRDEVREIMESAPATRVPGAREWVRGITNVRGRLVPVVDLVAFTSGGQTEMSRASRLIVVNHAEIPAAIIVDEVMGFRRFAAKEFSVVSNGSDDDSLALGHCRRGQEEWPVLSLIKLVESARFSDIAA